MDFINVCLDVDIDDIVMHCLWLHISMELTLTMNGNVLCLHSNDMNSLKSLFK